VSDPEQIQEPLGLAGGDVAELAAGGPDGLACSSCAGRFPRVYSRREAPTRLLCEECLDLEKAHAAEKEKT